MVEKIFRVVISKMAITKLREIHSNYRSKHSVELAEKIKKGLLSASRTLKKLPESKPILPSKKKVVPPHRYTKKWSFKIIFQVFKNDDTVMVNDFIHDKEHPGKWEDV